MLAAASRTAGPACAAARRAASSIASPASTMRADVAYCADLVR